VRHDAVDAAVILDRARADAGGAVRPRRRDAGVGLGVDDLFAGVVGPGHLDWNVADWPERVAEVGPNVGRHEEQRDDRGEERGQLHCVDTWCVPAHKGDTRAIWRIVFERPLGAVHTHTQQTPEEEDG